MNKKSVKIMSETRSSLPPPTTAASLVNCSIDLDFQQFNPFILHVYYETRFGFSKVAFKGCP